MTSSVFEAPESRAEAILQNILGANNVLVPPEAPVEEILQAILYNTPYTKEAETRIEKILLAIKNNGTYDEEAQSRDEEILISKLNETAYTKYVESRIEELLILWAAQSVIKQLEGVPPLTFTSQGQPLINWIINGVSGGVGDKTANLCDVDDRSLNWAVTLPQMLIYINQLSEGTYTLSYVSTLTARNDVTDNSLTGIIITSSVSSVDIKNRVRWGNVNVGASRYITIILEITTESKGMYTNVYLYGCGTDKGPTGSALISKFMLNTGSAALPFQPHGYKIPISCGGKTNTIYVDTPLYDGNSISMADTGIEIPTINGQNTLAVDTTVQPEKVYIEYK